MRTSGRRSSISHSWFLGTPAVTWPEPLRGGGQQAGNLIADIYDYLIGGFGGHRPAERTTNDHRENDVVHS